MKLYGFTSTPSLLGTIPSHYNQYTKLCHRSKLIFPFRTASVSTLHTVFCATSEPHRKRGRPTGSKNRPKLGKDQGQDKARTSLSPIEETSKLSDKQDSITIHESGEAEIQSLTQAERKSAENVLYDGVQSTATPTRKRGRPRKQNIQHFSSDERTPTVGAPETIESNANTGSKRRRGRPKKSGYDQGTNISSTETVSETLKSNKASKFPTNQNRGRPRSISIGFEQMIVAESLKSNAGKAPKSLETPRKRGRPQGSKNKSKRISVSPELPFDLPYGNVPPAANRQHEPDFESLFEMYNNSHVKDFPEGQFSDWKNKKLKAPNGLPGSGPDDFIFELIPLVAKLEAQKNRTLSEKEKNIRRFIDKTFHQFASSHRSDRRQLNLKPFKLREDEKKVCLECQGDGMVTCKYCEGLGFVDFGENAYKFYEEFGTSDVTLPKQMMGSIYQCPKCDGSTQEECNECSGTGSIADRFPRKPGASRTPINNFAKEEFDINHFLEEEKDRIEIGLDGTIILRASRRRNSKKEDSREIETEKYDRLRNEKGLAPEEPDFTRPVRRSQTLSPAIMRLRAFLQKDGTGIFREPSDKANRNTQRPSSSGTDFINTTDYKVGRSLRHRKPIQFSSETSVKKKKQSRVNEEPEKGRKRYGQEYITEKPENM